MKSAWRRITLTFALFSIVFFSCATFSAPYPTEDQYRKAIAEAAFLVKSEGLEVEVYDAQKEGVNRPLMAAGLSLTKGTCMIFFNTLPRSDLTEFVDTIAYKDLSVWLNMLAVHEVAHCIEQREAYIHKQFQEVLPPYLKLKDVTIQGYLSVVKSGAIEAWGEAFADIVAVLYIKSTLPGEWMRFATSLADMRDLRASGDSGHNTAPWLRRVIAANAEIGVNQTIYQAAFEMRKKYRPPEP